MTGRAGRVARLTLYVASCLGCVMPARLAHAQRAADAVVLIVPDCLGASGVEVEKLVALELAPRLQVVAERSERALVGSVRCSAPHALVVVEDPARGEPLSVELDLAAAAPAARERLLALTLAELITTSQLERAPPPATPATPAQDAARQDAAREDTASEDAALAPDSDEPDEDRRRTALELWVAPALGLAGEPAAPLFGGQLGGSQRLGPVLASLELQALFGQSERASSDVSVRVISAAIALSPVILDSGVQLSAGLGLRVGHVTLSAAAHRTGLQGDELAELWLGPAVLAALQLPVAEQGALRWAFEAGYVARPVVGTDEREDDRMALRGLWLTTSVGFAFRML